MYKTCVTISLFIKTHLEASQRLNFTPNTRPSNRLMDILTSEQQVGLTLCLK